MNWPTTADVQASTDELRAAHQVYIETVSFEQMAASLETCSWLLAWCRLNQPGSVCDLGSGFSSYVLRVYASEADHPVEVMSVDTDIDWLDRTEGFLFVRDLHWLGDLLTLDEFLATDKTSDLVFHDIANGETREALAPVALERSTAITVFDDCQHHGHRAAFTAATSAADRQFIDLSAWTYDKFGRFAFAAAKERPARLLDLEAEYQRLCVTPSDIYEHLPTFVSLVEELNAQHVIELGTRTGVSTVAWLWALTGTDGHLTSIDIDERPDIGHHDHWTFIQGDDLDPSITSALEPADIVFIDTSHLYDQTLKELNVYRWLVKPGGLILLHDTELPIPEGAPPRPLYPVKTAVVEFCEANGYEWLNNPRCWGLGLIRMGG